MRINKSGRWLLAAFLSMTLASCQSAPPALTSSSTIVHENQSKIEYLKQFRAQRSALGNVEKISSTLYTTSKDKSGRRFLLDESLKCGTNNPTFNVDPWDGTGPFAVGFISEAELKAAFSGDIVPSRITVNYWTPTSWQITYAFGAFREITTANLFPDGDVLVNVVVPTVYSINTCNNIVQIAPTPEPSPIPLALSVADPGVFSPNGDQLQDTIALTIDASGPWTLSAQGQAAPIASGNGSTTIAWNGRLDTQPSPLGDGEYTLRLAPGPGTLGDEDTARVKIDTQAPRLTGARFGSNRGPDDPGQPGARIYNISLTASATDLGLAGIDPDSVDVVAEGAYDDNVVYSPATGQISYTGKFSSAEVSENDFEITLYAADRASNETSVYTTSQQQGCTPQKKPKNYALLANKEKPCGDLGAGGFGMPGTGGGNFSTGPGRGFLEIVSDPKFIGQLFGSGSRRAVEAAIGKAGPGKELHHIVGQFPANVNRFGRPVINNSYNLFAIDRGVHHEISGIYSGKPLGPGGLTFRQMQAELTYEEQYIEGFKITNRILAKHNFPPLIRPF